MTKVHHEFYRYLRKEIELTPEEIGQASPNEIFDLVLAYEGFGRHAGFAIRRWIQLIYDVDLNDLSLDALLEGGADRE